MTAAELKAAATKLFGERGYSMSLARALGLSYAQIWRYLYGRSPIPGPVVAAVKSWLREREASPVKPHRESEADKKQEYRG